MNKFTILLTGLEKLRTAVQLGDAATHARMERAIREGTRQVCADAVARAHRVSGEMASTIRDEYAKDGLTGYAKVGYGKLLRRSKSGTLAGKARLKATRRLHGSKSGLGAYAPVVERGDPRRHHLPHPFMIPAFEAARSSIVAGCDQALRGGVGELERAL